MPLFQGLSLPGNPSSLWADEQKQNLVEGRWLAGQYGDDEGNLEGLAILASDWLDIYDLNDLVEMASQWLN